MDFLDLSFALWQDEHFGFIRERVSLNGECRPLEDAKDLPFLHLPLEEIGVVKEAPVSTPQHWDIVSLSRKTVESDSLTSHRR